MQPAGRSATSRSGGGGGGAPTDGARGGDAESLQQGMDRLAISSGAIATQFSPTVCCVRAT